MSRPEDEMKRKQIDPWLAIKFASNEIQPEYLPAFLEDCLHSDMESMKEDWPGFADYVEADARATVAAAEKRLLARAVKIFEPPADPNHRQPLRTRATDPESE